MNHDGQPGHAYPQAPLDEVRGMDALRIVCPADKRCTCLQVKPLCRVGMLELRNSSPRSPVLTLHYVAMNVVTDQVLGNHILQLTFHGSTKVCRSASQLSDASNSIHSASMKTLLRRATRCLRLLNTCQNRRKEGLNGADHLGVRSDKSNAVLQISFSVSRETWTSGVSTFCSSQQLH